MDGRTGGIYRIALLTKILFSFSILTLLSNLADCYEYDNLATKETTHTIKDGCAALLISLITFENLTKDTEFKIIIILIDYIDFVIRKCLQVTYTLQHYE